MMHTRQMHLAALTILGLAVALPQQARAQQATPSVEAQIAAQIVDREPQEAGAVFAADVGQVYCWSRVSGAEGTTIQHVWIHDDTEYPVSLDIGGSPWRTWSSKSIPPEWAGDWRVEIRDGQGNMMETLSFTVGG